MYMCSSIMLVYLSSIYLCMAIITSDFHHSTSTLQNFYTTQRSANRVWHGHWTHHYTCVYKVIKLIIHISPCSVYYLLSITNQPSSSSSTVFSSLLLDLQKEVSAYHPDGFVSSSASFFSDFVLWSPPLLMHKYLYSSNRITELFNIQ